MGTEETTGQEPVIEPTDQESTGGNQSSDVLSLADAKKLRRENQSLRERLHALEEENANHKKAQMTELERAKAEAKEAAERAEAVQAALRQAKAEAAISRVAIEKQVDPDLLSGLVKVEFDKDGNPKGIDAAVDELLTKYPYLKGGVSLNTANPQRQRALTLDDIRRMTPEQINARWTEVEAALKASRQQ